MSRGPRAHWAVISMSQCTQLPDEDRLQEVISEALAAAGLPPVKKVTYITDQSITLNVDLEDVCRALDESEDNKKYDQKKQSCKYDLDKEPDAYKV